MKFLFLVTAAITADGWA